jgi:DNA modification methylase
MGSGTTAATAKKLGRKYAGTELNEEYKPLQDQRIKESVYQPDLFEKLDK